MTERPYKPTLGGRLHSPFAKQFEKGFVNSVSLSCTLVEQLSLDGSDMVLSHASGCFWRHENSVFLLTARHVLSGQRWYDGSMISPQRYRPERIVVYPTVSHAPGMWSREKVKLEVEHDPPNWLQDPEFEELRTDIAAIRIDAYRPDSVRCLNDDNGIFDELYTLVGMECSIVGYPNTEFSDLMTPIWRRGSIASEPLLPIDGKPMFLLDATTGPGLSGSPVLRHHFGPLPELQADGSITISHEAVGKITFVGIYAGRLDHEHLGGQVAYVFYGNRVPRLFETIA